MSQNPALPLLAWYDLNHRTLPWRVSPSDKAQGLLADPYLVWLSEIMLQQTTVTAVRPYFETFARRWPDVTALANADPDDVMKAWAGLGYYSRARNLIACARAVVADHGGLFPETEDELRALPGIGPYTAAAISAIAFGHPAAVVDGNIERVFARLHAIDTPLPAAKKEIRALVGASMPSDRPGDFAQALMDLGSSICTPRRPNCGLCPLNESCLAHAAGAQETYPVKLARKERPVRRGAAFVASNASGAVLLVKRPAKGLLGGMSGVPTTAWGVKADGATGVETAPFPAPWRGSGTVRHIFTHFELRLDVFHAEVTKPVQVDGWFSAPDRLSGEALPSVMKKVISAALPDAFQPMPGSASGIGKIPKPKGN